MKKRKKSNGYVTYLNFSFAILKIYLLHITYYNKKNIITLSSMMNSRWSPVSRALSSAEQPSGG